MEVLMSDELFRPQLQELDPEYQEYMNMMLHQRHSASNDLMTRLSPDRAGEQTAEYEMCMQRRCF